MRSLKLKFFWADEPMHGGQTTDSTLGARYWSMLTAMVRRVETVKVKL